MKKITTLLSAGMLLLASVVFGQEEKNISPMVAGTKLTDADIGFLSMVSNAKLDMSRGGGAHTAIIRRLRYAAGQTLTSNDATTINTAFKAFQKTYRATIIKQRGAGYCYYWYYYCDAWGYCWWYKYWYYC